MLANLLGNAIKHHHDRDSLKVRVGVREDGDFYEFAITDNGPGTEPRYHARIFEAFQTLQSRDDIESTGIGLSVVKKIVELQGGSVRVDSDQGRGSRFTFRWPREADQDARDLAA